VLDAAGLFAVQREAVPWQERGRRAHVRRAHLHVCAAPEARDRPSAHLQEPRSHEGDEAR